MVVFILSVCGLAAGSFINALIWRIHKQWDLKSRTKRAKYSIIKGRSICEKCHHTLAWYDLLPLVSWLLLRGKCRYCKKPIGWQPVVLEMLMPLLFFSSYMFWPLNFDLVGKGLFGLWLISLVLLVALAIYDYSYMLLPDKLVYPLIGLATIVVVIRFIHPCEIPINLLGVIGSVLIAGGLFLALYVLSKGKLIGGGDVKLGLALGLLLGQPELSLLMLFVASLSGTALALPNYLSSKKVTKVPFGPHLILATFVCFMFGESLVDWYISAIGLTSVN